jgi:hypothetical protein
MLEEPTSEQFVQDPLRVLDQHAAHGRNMFRIGRSATGGNAYIVGDAHDARAVLRNSEGSYQEHSDFFSTRHGYFGPRETQLDIRRAARELLRTQVADRGNADLARFLQIHLPRTSQWPDTGNRLAYRYLQPLLIAPDSPPKLIRLLDQIVERAVLAKARAGQPRWRRMLLQFRTTLQLSGAIEGRRKLARPTPSDLLDVVAAAARPEHRVDDLSEVFLSFLFASAGSVGFVFAWSLYLLGTQPPREVPAEWVVQEALRLWPVAWQLGRSPAESHSIAGIEVSAGDDVVVCPYSVQRHPQFWSEPDVYRPERWADPGEWRNPAFIPFGHGPHRCIAADIATQLVSDMLRFITEHYRLEVTASSSAPTVEAAMAPPPFTLTLEPRG